MRKTLLAWSAAALAAAGTGCATFHEGAELPPPEAELTACQESVAARLQYLEPRLVAHGRYANRWWWLWNGVHALGIVYGGALAGTADDGGERALAATDATKATIGLARGVLDPPVLRRSVDEIRKMDVASPAGCVARLNAAEKLLYDAASEARDERRGWLPHAGNVALNVVGAVVVAEGFDESRGWGSGALGLVVGEIEIWSYPWHAEDTVKDYERLFPRDDLSTPRWRIEEDDGETVMILD